MEQLIEWWNATTLGSRALMFTLISMALIQLSLDLWQYIRLSLWTDRSYPTHSSGVSIVICAKNEEKRLRNLIPILMEQDYPNFEVIIVDDTSWDDTLDTLQAYQVRHSNLHVVSLNEDIQRMRGKKFALTMGIKGYQHDIVLLTDADCVPSGKDWITKMTAPFGDEQVEIVLGASPLNKQKSWLNKVIRFDTSQIAISYLSAGLRKMPYMGVGRNLAYRKEIFFRNSGFKSHLNLASGDDDLFINEVATKKNTHIVVDQDAFTTSDAKETWQDWFVQKRRHLTTAPHYKLKTKFFLILAPLSFNLMWLSAILSMVLHNAFLIASVALLVRYTVHFVTFRGSLKKLGQPDLLFTLPLLEAYQAAINPVLWISNLLSKPRTWK
ncbi:MAG: cellulose synthase/poly-beta-1,6-N-acetylglucosamine synthase-like glycosyltransferase [Flavobacteriales bacterium]|jgi:cellulose synthase/poly-beta-1,6-N-acetylglucosamine synthase-like glycosyltransferase